MLKYPKEYPAKLKCAVSDGVSHAAMLGVGETYVNACGVFLGGSPLMLGVLASVPPLLGALAQNVALYLMRQIQSRRKLVTVAASINGALWFPIGLAAAFLYGEPIGMQTLILLVCLYHITAGLGGPVWNSLIGDLVPSEQRGSYFGYRSKLCGLATFAGVLAGGYILSYFEGLGSGFRGAAQYGFLTIFVIAGGLRLLSAKYLSCYEDPPYEVRAGDQFTFWQFVRRLPRSNFAKFVFFFSFVNFGVSLGGPMFGLYLLRELRFDYWEYTAVAGAAVLAQYIFLERWGKVSDLIGNRRIIKVCSVGVVSTPLLWLLTDSPLGLAAAQMFSGVMWAGFSLAATNFMFDAVSAPKRARCVAYQAIINGILVCIGTLLGARLLQYLPADTSFGNPSLITYSPFLWLFIASAIMRALPVLLFLPRIREVRSVQALSRREIFFRMAHVRPFSGSDIAALITRRKRRRDERSEIDNG